MPLDRRVSCKDLGTGDCQGWLYRRRDKGVSWGQSHWAKRWCVLKEFNLFYYKDKEALKADGVVHLPAFQVSPVEQTELKTKKYAECAFKIHNAGTSFYFASDRQEDMSKWMNKMGLAAITFNEHQQTGFRKPEPGKFKDSPNEYYSESDDDDDGSTQNVSRDPSPTPSSLNNSPATTRSITNSVELPRGSDNSNIDSLSASMSSLASSQSESRTSAPILSTMSADLMSSQENVATLVRRHTQKGIDIFTGHDKNAMRRSTLSRQLIEKATPEKIRMKKLKSLERTLKAKEDELSEIDLVLHGNSPDKLSLFRNMLSYSGSKGAYSVNK